MAKDHANRRLTSRLLKIYDAVGDSKSGNFPLALTVCGDMGRLFSRARCRSFSLLLLMVIDVSVLANSTAPAKKTDGVIAFTNVTLVPMDREGVVQKQTVIVRGEKIVEIGPSSAVSLPVDATVIDGTGRYLLPGLADMHIHLDSLIHPRLNFGDAPLFLAYGVTTVLNLRGTTEQLAWRQRIRNGELLAPNLYTSGEFINEPSERTPDEVEREVLRQFHEGYDVVKYHQIVDADGRYITTSGLSRPAYMRMNEVARRLGMPLLGHAPVNLGLDALLDAHQSLAHIGEFVPLYFLPPDPKVTGLFLPAGVASLLVLLVSCAVWMVLAVAYRARKIGPAEPSVAVLRIRKTAFAFTGLSIASMALSVGLILQGNLLWLIVATIATLVSLLLAVSIAVATASCWRKHALSPWTRVHLAVVALAAVTFVSATAYWLPTLWRSSDARLAKVAASARRSGIWVETTLNLYGTSLMTQQQRAELFEEPAFKALSPEIRDEWTAASAQGLLPQWKSILFRNYPEFTLRLTRALHRAGVPLLLGTDALGFPLAIPGVSTHQELQLLLESGLTPFEALRTATVNPAEFLGKQQEFGTITVGKRADLLLVSADPLVDIHTLKSPIGVMVRGKWLPAKELQGMLHSLAQ